MKKILHTLLYISFVFSAYAQIDLQAVSIDQEKTGVSLRMIYKPAYAPSPLDQLKLLMYDDRSGDLVYEQPFSVDKAKEYSNFAKVVGKNLEIPYHLLELTPGTYTLRCIIELRNVSKEVDVQSLSKKITLNKPDYPSFKDQRFKIRRLRIEQQANLYGQGQISKGLTISYSLGWKNLFAVSKEGLTEYVHYVTIEKNGYRAAVLRPDGKRKFPIDLSPHDLSFELPYRNISLEKGLHKTMIRFWIEGIDEPIYEEKLILEQPTVFDLLLELSEATVEPPKEDNLSFGMRGEPDPQWFVKIGADGLHFSPVNRNSNQAKPYSLQSTLTNYDKLVIGLYDSDVLNDDILGEYTVNHGSQEFSQAFEGVDVDRASDLKFYVTKQKRKAPQFDLNTYPEYVYKGIKGVKLDCRYELPYHYTKNNLDIVVEGDSSQQLKHIIVLEDQRSKKELRHYGTYSCFVPDYYLTKTKHLHFLFKANKAVVHRASSDTFAIEPAVSHQSIEQQIGYVHKGISGVLYTIQYQVTKFPSLSDVKLLMHNLPASTCKEVVYWTAADMPKAAQDTFCPLSRDLQEQVMVFVPYYAAPKAIHPQFLLVAEVPEIPPLQITNFETTAYQRPTQLQDIQVRALDAKEVVYTGLAGQQFDFEISIPENYNSKGMIELAILANDTAVTQHYFINERAEAPLTVPLKGQKSFKVFIPYRYMEAPKVYRVELKVTHKDFLLAETKDIGFDYHKDQLVDFGLYLDQFIGKKHPEFYYKIFIRNTNTYNTTYEEANLEEIHSSIIAQKHKPDFPKPVSLYIHPKDAIRIMFYPQGEMQPDKACLTTTYEELAAAKKQFVLKNTCTVKKAIFKLVNR